MAEIPRWQTPISRWQLDGNANDLYGLNNGTENSTTYTTDSKQGSKAMSGGSVGLPTLIYRTSGYTFSAWFKNPGILNQFKSGSTFPRVNMAYTSGESRLYYYIHSAAGSVIFTDYLSYSDVNNWHHIVITDTGGTIKGYLDGALSSISGTYTPQALTLNTCSISGGLDDVRFYDVALTADEVMNLYKSYSIPIWQQPLHHWKLDGDATDSAGNINGTAVGTVMYSSSQKVSGNYSMLCDGGADYIDLGTFRFYEHTNFSIALWFKISGTGEKCFLSDSYTSIQSEIRIISNNNTLYYQVIKTGGSIFNDNYIGTFNDDKWHHLVICDANGVVTSYLDTISISINGTYTRVAITLDHSSIGATRVASGTRYFTGNLDDIRFYDVALSAADVKALYNSYFTEKAVNFMSML